jgi:hypothetical protein
MVMVLPFWELGVKVVRELSIEGCYTIVTLLLPFWELGVRVGGEQSIQPLDLLLPVW